MKDSYEVLGIYHTASDDEVKQAYKEMLRKYHPDNYVGSNNPLAPLAEEKFKEAQEAYNDIMKARARGYYGPLGDSSNSSGQYQQPFNRGNYGQSGQNGYNSAQGQPGYGGQQGQNGYNGQYQQPYQQNYQQQGNYYGRPANYNGYDSCGTGNLCCDLWCADTICECMGGDICSCI